MLPFSSSSDQLAPESSGSPAVAVGESTPGRDIDQSPDAESKHSRLPRGDYLILPLLSVATVLLIFGLTEVITRFVWAADEEGSCMAFDPTVGPHGTPNCVAYGKLPEGERIAYRFNECGYRSKASCGPKPPGKIRIAVIGSSIAEGYGVAYDDMFSTRAVDLLTRVCRHPVEFQNLGAEGSPPIYTYRHLDEALRLKPDIVLMPLNPWDVEQDIDPDLMVKRREQGSIPNNPEAGIHLNALQKLQAVVRDSRTALVAQHFLLQDRETFLKLYLVAGGDHTDFVRVPFTQRWEKRLADMDTLLGEMAEKTRAANVPFALMVVPERAQVMMLSARNLPLGVDPYAFGRRFAEIAAKHGIIYIDALRSFVNAPSPGKLFYVVDGHPTPRAHALMAQAIARELLASRTGLFATCSQPN